MQPQSNDQSQRTLPPRFPVLNVGISALTLPRAVAIIDEWIRTGQRYYVNVCTAHTVLECVDAPRLRDVVNHSGLSTPDGMPLVWLGKLHKHAISRVYGPDLMLALCAHGTTRGYRHFLYGGAAGVPEELARHLTAQFPELQIVGMYSPPFRPLHEDEKADVARMINDSGADIVWVGLGTPKQDYWVAEFRPLLNAAALIAIGAAFDFHAKRVKQAPSWMQRLGLEWAFRLSQDPKRLWKRYLLGNPRFVALLIRHWLQQRRVKAV